MIEIKNISKAYTNEYVLKDLNANIKKNTCIGLLGQNGAGKTSLMDIMCGVSTATSGDIIIDGVSLAKQALEYKKKISYAPEIPPLYPNLRVLEYLQFVAELKQIISGEIKNHLDEIIDICNIKDVIKKPIYALSKGYKQRLNIAQSLIGNAELLIFDEPTVGLDPKQLVDTMDILKKLKKSRSIMISSHRLYEIQELCKHVLILHKGKIVYNGNFESDSSLDISLKIAKEDSYIIEKIKQLDFVNKVQTSNCVNINDKALIALNINCKNENLPEAAINTLLNCHSVLIYELTRKKQSLESIFLRSTL